MVEMRKVLFESVVDCGQTVEKDYTYLEAYKRVSEVFYKVGNNYYIVPYNSDYYFKKTYELEIDLFMVVVIVLVNYVNIVGYNFSREN